MRQRPLDRNMSNAISTPTAHCSEETIAYRNLRRPVRRREKKSRFSRFVARASRRCPNRYETFMNVSRKIKIGRNDLCPCGSGKKYKRCCLEAGPGRKRFFAETATLEREMSRGECSAPVQWKNDCSARIAKAHTVPRASLRRIADSGHVLSFLPSAASLSTYGPALPPQRRGIGVASTFTGFCARHDDALFAPLEKVPFIGTKEQCFLLAYRALARELYLKRAILRFLNRRDDELSKKLRFPEERALLPADLLLAGTADGERHMRSHKIEYDHALSLQEYDSVRAYVIELPEPPPVMCSGGIFPEHTFAGERLQILNPGTNRPSQMCFSSFADSAQGFVVFAWLDDGLDHCDRLVDSLRQLPDDSLSERLLRFFFECCENVHIQPCWWNSLPKPAQQKLISHMDASSEFGPRDRARDFFSDDGIDYGTWPIVRRYAVPEGARILP